MVLIANQHESIRKKLDEAGVLQYFTHTTVSNEYKLEKPDSRIFSSVLEEVGVDSKNTVMIDDNIERGLIPAKEIGMVP